MLPVKPQGVHWILDQKHSIHEELHNDEQMERNKNNSCSLFLSKTPLPPGLGSLSFYAALDAGFHLPHQTMSCSLKHLTRRTLMTTPKNTSFIAGGWAGKAQPLPCYCLQVEFQSYLGFLDVKAEFSSPVPLNQEASSGAPS